jgi:hypothetical protein
MRVLILLCLVIPCLFSTLLLAENANVSNGLLKVVCTITDSTDTNKDIFLAGEPIIYLLSIYNQDIYSINYRSSTFYSDIATVSVVPYKDSVNYSTDVPTGLDSSSVLLPKHQIYVTKTVFIREPGKYVFSVTPHFQFRKDILPDIGQLDRIFQVIKN